MESQKDEELWEIENMQIFGLLILSAFSKISAV